MTAYRLEPELIGTELVVGDSAERRRDAIQIGRLAESGPLRNLWLDISGEQVLAVLGKRGTGKSYTLGVVLEALAAGQGTTAIARLTTPRSALMLDIMDIYWSTQISLSGAGSPEIAKQHENMKRAGMKTQPLNIDVWLPAGYENPQIDPPGVRTLTVSPSELEIDDWAALFDVDIFNEPRGMLIADCLDATINGYSRTDGSLASGTQAFSFPDLLTCLDTSQDIATNYDPNTLRSIRQRFSSYAALALFMGPGTPLRQILSPFKASVLMLARVPDALKNVIVATILRRLLRERRDASMAQKRLDLDANIQPAERTRLQTIVAQSVPRSWVLMDEAHILAGTDSSVSKDAFVKFAKEGRNYGLSLALATQQPSALDSRLMSQVEGMLVHQLTAPKDAAVATQAMRSPLPTKIQVDGQETDLGALLRRLGQGQAVFSSGNAPSLPRLCIASVRPRISAHGGYEA